MLPGEKALKSVRVQERHTEFTGCRRRRTLWSRVWASGGETGGGWRWYGPVRELGDTVSPH